MEDENFTDIYYEIEESSEMDEPDSVRHVAMGILAFLAISGTIGNALVLYVFSSQKQKLSSTIFILTLAGTDFITSLVTIPYTITIEVLKYNVRFDAICKLYHLLVTTTIPFSAFVMVAIAVDRYLCIVHPFRHTMTIKRAKVSVVVLAILAFTLGLLCCLMYGVYQKNVVLPKHINQILLHNNITQGIRFSANSTAYTDGDISIRQSQSEFNETLENLFNNPNEIIHISDTGKCHKNGLIFDASFFNVYQKIYSSFFGVCAVIVIVLYAIIYRSVLTRRRRRLHLTNACCAFIPQTGTGTMENDHEQTEFTVLNNLTKDKSPTSLNGSKKFEDTSFKEDTKQQDDTNDKNGNAACSARVNLTADKDTLVRPIGVSRAKLEKLRMANIKTALMLSIVALTYIIAFMPAWLMALRVIHMNVIVFYLYFTYNVANPIIYAFLNQSFRNHLQALFKCGH